jgi:uncharacterized protein YdeI (YjbR/CyaY-like superfamily)
MSVKDQRVDEYIQRSAEFARPILEHLRSLVHKACPDCEETIKWGFPHFEYKGAICNMAAFKNHCAFGFWKASLLKDSEKLLSLSNKASMGHFNRITTLKDLPPGKTLIAYIKEAVALNEAGVKLPAKSKSEAKKESKMPDDLASALRKNKKAGSVFEKFSPSNKKEYIDWIEDAKTDATREKRIATAVEWIYEGKSRNWKYK